MGDTASTPGADLEYIITLASERQVKPSEKEEEKGKGKGKEKENQKEKEKGPFEQSLFSAGLSGSVTPFNLGPPGRHSEMTRKERERTKRVRRAREKTAHVTQVSAIYLSRK